MTHARLTDGSSAVANTEAYVRAFVRACDAGGYPGLTGDGVREWYGSEEGLRLEALDADSAALAAAASVAEEALAMHREALAVLTDSWTGESGSAAAVLLGRHCREAFGLVAALHLAAGELASLRDKLEQLVDEKVDTAIRIDDRRAAERPSWLAHAQAALDGADPVALRAVMRDIGPYVASDIRGDWLAAMQSSTESIGGAYEQSRARLTDRSSARFELPSAPAAAAEAVPGWPGAASAQPQSSPAWSPAAPVQTASALTGVLPALAGVAAGFITQIAGALAPDSGPYADLPADSADGASPNSQQKAESGPVDKPMERPSSGPVLPPEPSGSIPVPPVAVAQPDDAPERLLAAELPLQRDAAPPAVAGSVPGTQALPPQHNLGEAADGSTRTAQAIPESRPQDPETPCEIAADELPQVGS